MSANPPYFKHATISAVARVLHDHYEVEGGIALLRRAARIRLAIAGTGHDRHRVWVAIETEEWVPTDDVIEKIIRAVRITADYNIAQDDDML